MFRRVEHLTENSFCPNSLWEICWFGSTISIFSREIGYFRSTLINTNQFHSYFGEFGMSGTKVAKVNLLYPLNEPQFLSKLPDQSFF